MRGRRPIYTYIMWKSGNSFICSVNLSRTHDRPHSQPLMYKAPNIQSPKTENCHQLGGVHVRISQNSEFFFPMLNSLTHRVPPDTPTWFVFYGVSKQRAVKCHYLLNNLFYCPTQYTGSAFVCIRV